MSVYLGTLSKVFQSNQLNLPAVEKLVQEKLGVLEELKSIVFCEGFMIELAKKYPTELPTTKTSFNRQAVKYYAEQLFCIRSRFP